MLQIIKNSRPSYSQEIINKLDEYSYRNKRYQINFALALIYCKKDINLDEIIDIQRRTDKFIPLDKNLCCVVFDSIDYASSKKVASNLQKQVEESCLNEDLFIGVITSIEYESASKMTNYLFNMLERFLYNLELENKLATVS